MTSRAPTGSRWSHYTTFDKSASPANPIIHRCNIKFDLTCNFRPTMMPLCALYRILVIVAEDSFLHPAAPLLGWLMVATSKGYRPPPCFVDVFLCTVYEIAKCPVRDSTDSCRTTKPVSGEAENCMDDKFAPPHPRDMVAPIHTAGTRTVRESNIRHGARYKGCRFCCPHWQTFSRGSSYAHVASSAFLFFASLFHASRQLMALKTVPKN